MRTSTACNHSTRLDAKATDVFERARSYSLSHKKICDLLAAEVYSDPAYSKIPRADRSYINGRIKLRFSMLYEQPERNAVAWYLVIREDGTTARNWDELTESEAEEFRVGKRDGLHAWNKTKEPF